MFVFVSAKGSPLELAVRPPPPPSPTPLQAQEPLGLALETLCILWPQACVSPEAGAGLTGSALLY